MSIEQFRLIANGMGWLAIAGFLLSLLRFARIPVAVRLVGILQGCSFLAEQASIWLRINGISPNHASTAYNLAQLILLSTSYYFVMGRKRWKAAFLITGGGMLLFGLVNWIFIQQGGINSFSKVTSSIYFLVLSILFFYVLLKDLPTQSILQLPMFWINSGVMIYFSGSLTLFILSDYLVNTLHNDLMLYWTFHNFLGIIKNILFIIGIWMGVRTIRSQ